MATLLFAEVSKGHLSDITARALTAAAQLGGAVDVLIAGRDVGGAAEAASKLAGIARVRVADDATSFVTEVDRALAAGSAGAEARVALAEANSWSSRVSTLMGLIEQKLGSSAGAGNDEGS